MTDTTQVQADENVTVAELQRQIDSLRLENTLLHKQLDKKQQVKVPAQAEKPIQIQTLIQPLSPVESMEKSDAALAVCFDEGWEMLSSETILNADKFVRIVILKREGSAEPVSTPLIDEAPAADADLFSEALKRNSEPEQIIDAGNQQVLSVAWRTAQDYRTQYPPLLRIPLLEAKL